MNEAKILIGRGVGSSSEVINVSSKNRVTKNSHQLLERTSDAKALVAHKNEQTAIAFIADQSAPREAHWMNFLHQDTAVFTGPEKLAIKFNFPVVYLHIERPRRGFYEISFKLISEEPCKTAENEISEKFMRLLEEDILKDPVPWLWSHKRWKHKRHII